MAEEMTLEQLQEENRDLRAENESLKAEITKLVDSNYQGGSAVKAGEIFEFEGRSYKLLAASMRLPKLVKLSAADILASEEAKAWLVNNKSGSITEVK